MNSDLKGCNVQCSVKMSEVCWLHLTKIKATLAAIFMSKIVAFEMLIP